MLTIDPESGLIREARQVPSPNQDERPKACEPELIVIHGISLPPGEFGGPWIDALFTNCLDSQQHPCFHEVARMEVSSHLMIRRDGELVQYVSLWKRAWHAGQSCHEGRERCNDFSVGIELEGTDDVPYTDEQYDVLYKTIVGLRKSIPSLSGAPVVGHSDISPGRKTDPGPLFDWTRLRKDLDDRNETQLG